MDMIMLSYAASPPSDAGLIAVLSLHHMVLLVHSLCLQPLLQATTKLESQASAAASQAADSAAEARTLKDTLASSNNAKQEALSEAEQLRRDLKSEKNRTEQASITVDKHALPVCHAGFSMSVTRVCRPSGLVLPTKV